MLVCVMMPPIVHHILKPKSKYHSAIKLCFFVSFSLKQFNVLKKKKKLFL